jgi:hypothetical protein
MKEHVKNLWVTALRSGEYSQTKDKLKTESGHCCLGVLCELYAKTQKKKGFQKNEKGIFYIQDSKIRDINKSLKQQAAILPTQVRRWAGISSETGEFVTKKGNLKELTDLNDNHGKSFKQIANTIDKYWEQL